MARIVQPSKAELRSWNRWVSGRPPSVRAVAERLDPWTLYCLKTTGQRVTVYSYSEDGTVTVDVDAAFNLCLFPARVFGIDPNDLSPCDLPGASDAVGALLSDADVEANRDVLRVAIRPDLFVMGPDGKAVRKS